MKTVYLDYNATTPIDPRVLEVMLPYLRETFGNAASRQHTFGLEAQRAVDQARAQLAGAIGADEREIVWTSGATESNNLAIFGVADWYKSKGRHIVTSRVEHKAVIDPCRVLEQRGYEITWLAPDVTGRISAEQVRNGLRDDTILVSIMLANNEVGTVNPIEEIGAMCKNRGVLFHTDAAQAPGKMLLDVHQLNADLLTLSAHKVYGPKGIGALYVRRKRPRVRLTPILYGGGQERGYRSGTLNVPGIVGMGEAFSLASSQLNADRKKMLTLRQMLWDGLVRIPGSKHGNVDHTVVDTLQNTSTFQTAPHTTYSRAGVMLNGHPTERLPNTLNVSFAEVDAEQLIHALDHIAVSSGSACTTASLESSYVLAALGFDENRVRGAVRFSLGRFTTREEIDYTITRVTECVSTLRQTRPTALDPGSCT